MKYLLLRTRDEIIHPIIFDPTIQHESMRARFPNWELVSAGKINLNTLKCSAKSVSLNIEYSNTQSMNDTTTVAAMINLAEQMA